MARKSSFASTVVSIARAIEKANRAAKNERAREIREAERNENARIAAQKRYEAQLKKNAREEERRRKALAAEQAKQDAEHARLKLAQTSLDDFYGASISRHQEITAQLSRLSPKASPDDVISLCLEDCAIIPQLYDYCLRKQLIDGTPCSFPKVNTFTLLSEAYESQGRYDRAILACKDALELGISEGMETRIQHLNHLKRAEAV